MKQLQQRTINIGCDPEFFLRNKDQIIESSKILPSNGLEYTNYHHGAGKSAKFTIDGVQIELNPNPSHCRALIGNEMRTAFNRLKTLLDEKKVSATFTGVIKLSDTELTDLSDGAKKFGCAPSRNYYTKKESVISVDAAKYNYRSAGGHIHLGGGEHQTQWLELLKKRPRLVVRYLDLICGNTCVLLDRDPMQVERRKVYGRAGEYRLPAHGIEYRTPSNFWLKSYQLFSLVTGLARFAGNIALAIYIDEGANLGKKEHESEYRQLLKLCSKSDVQKAINTNDFDLAKKNFDNIKDTIIEITPNNSSFFPLWKNNIKEFEYFVSKGIDYWFKDDPVTHWCKLGEGHGIGWEAFSEQQVRNDMYMQMHMNATKKVEDGHA